MALSVYTSHLEETYDKGMDWVADTINIIIMTNAGYTFSAAHNFRDDLGTEVSGTGYSAGGLALDNKTLSAANPSLASSDDEVIAQNGAGFNNGRKYALATILGGASSADPLHWYGAAAGDFGNVAGQLTLDVPSNFISLSA